MNGDNSMKKQKFLFSAVYHPPLAPVNYSGSDRTGHMNLFQNRLGHLYPSWRVSVSGNLVGNSDPIID